MSVTPAGWHPDPAGGAPGRLRWWDGQAWTDHVHDPAPSAPPPTASPLVGSVLDASVLVVGPPRVATPGTRVFELEDGAGGRLGRLVETSRGVNDSSLGAALSRSKSWQHATTRELRGPTGYPELVLAWGPAHPGLLTVSLPDRREIGRLVSEATGWALVSFDARRCGTATAAGVVGDAAQPCSAVTPDPGGGWHTTIEGGPHPDPLRSLVIAAAAVADVVATLAS